MNYKGFTIIEHTVQRDRGSASAFAIVNAAGYTLAMYSSLDRVKKTIDRNGTRWLQQANQAVIQ